jgi:hypothetical protein
MPALEHEALHAGCTATCGWPSQHIGTQETGESRDMPHSSIKSGGASASATFPPGKCPDGHRRGDLLPAGSHLHRRPADPLAPSPAGVRVRRAPREQARACPCATPSGPLAPVGLGPQIARPSGRPATSARYNPTAHEPYEVTPACHPA